MRVLVVEDGYLVALELVRLLDELGVVVLGPVPSVAAALEMIGDRVLDCALLDVNLGEESVFPVAEALAHRTVPFAFATGYENSALPDGYQGHLRLEKPVTRHAVVEILHKLRAGGATG